MMRMIAIESDSDLIIGVVDKEGTHKYYIKISGSKLTLEDYNGHVFKEIDIDEDD